MTAVPLAARQASCRCSRVSAAQSASALRRSSDIKTKKKKATTMVTGETGQPGNEVADRCLAAHRPRVPGGHPGQVAVLDDGRAVGRPPGQLPLLEGQRRPVGERTAPVL